MVKHSKRYNSISSVIGLDDHNPKDAIAKIKTNATAKFVEAVELHISTGVDPKQSDQQVREVAELPHGTGKDVKVFVFADGDDAKLAENSGADYVVNDDFIKKIEDGWSDFDVAIATPDQMPKIGRLGRFLGRKGFMPNPKTGTVVESKNLPNAISESKHGRVEIKLDKGANVHVRIGTVEFNEDQILDNLKSVYSIILNSKPENLKGQFIKTATICTTMGPSVKLNLNEMENFSNISS